MSTEESSKTSPEPKKLAEKKGSKLWSVCMFILVVEACERFCYYTIFPTMVSYLEDAGCDFDMLNGDKKSCMGASGAFALRSSFRMIAYIAPVFGGYIADNILGRYKTIMWFTGMYVIGVSMMTVGAIPSIMKDTSGLTIYIVGAFVFTAIGTGAIKPNVVNFGADQYDADDPDEAAQQKSFFSYFYMVINVGSVFASVWTSSMATSDVTSSGAGTGFLKALGLSALAMAASLLAFIFGTPRYSAKSKEAVTKVPMVSIIRKHLTQAANEGIEGKLSILGFSLLPVYLIVTLIGSLVGSASQPVFLKFGTASGITLCSAIAFVLCTISSFALIIVHRKNDWLRPIAQLPEQVSQAISTDEVKTALRVIPTIMCINIGFNVGYNGMDIYGAAACQMDVRLDVPWLQDVLLLPNGQFNGNFFSLGNNSSIIIAVPFIEGFLFPKLRQMRGKPISRKAKYVVGFALIILANLVGALIELVRRGRDFIPCPADLMGSDKCGAYDGVDNLLLSQCSPGGQLPMSDMSGWWTFIPYFITGCGEVLVNPVLQEFCFDEVAPRLRSLMMGFTLIAMGCTPSVITAIFAGFVPTDMNDGNVIWCYMANNMVSIILLVAYFFIAIPDKVERRSEEKTQERDITGTCPAATDDADEFSC